MRMKYYKVIVLLVIFYFIYEYHFKITGNNEQFVNKLIDMYLTGIKWITEYYFSECSNWRWHYVCYYAPFISDVAYYIKIKNIDLNNIKFNCFFKRGFI